MGESAKSGKRGAVVIRPAVTVPIEVWPPNRRAAFLPENAVDVEDYEWARREVGRMGLDPDRIATSRFSFVSEAR